MFVRVEYHHPTFTTPMGYALMIMYLGIVLSVQLVGDPNASSALIVALTFIIGFTLFFTLERTGKTVKIGWSYVATNVIILVAYCLICMVIMREYWAYFVCGFVASFITGLTSSIRRGTFRQYLPYFPIVFFFVLRFVYVVFKLNGYPLHGVLLMASGVAVPVGYVVAEIVKGCKFKYRPCGFYGPREPVFNVSGYTIFLLMLYACFVAPMEV